MQNKWLWGCGIGCGALIVLVGLVGIGFAGYGLKYKDQAKTAITNGLRSYFDKLKQEGKVKVELQEPISELITLVQRPETPVMAMMTITGIVTEIMTNESVDPQLTLPAINDFTDLLKAKPTPTVDEVSEVYKKHEAMLDALDKRPVAEKVKGAVNGSQQPATGN